MKKLVVTLLAVLAILTVALPPTVGAGGTAFDTPECDAWSHNPGSVGLAYECLYSITFSQWW